MTRKTTSRPFLRNGIAISFILAQFFTVSEVYSAGTSGFPILKTYMDPVSLALSGANLADSKRKTLSLNPATVSQGDGFWATSIAKHPVDMWSGSIAYTKKQDEKMYISASIESFNYGTFEYSGIENQDGEFTSAEYVLSAGVSHIWNSRFQSGIKMKFVWGKLENESASGVVMDAGLIYDLEWEDVQTAFLFQNVGSISRYYGSDSPPPPTEVGIALSKKLAHLPLVIYTNVGLVDNGEGDINVKYGKKRADIVYRLSGEFTISAENSESPAFVRLGYQSLSQGLKVGNKFDPIAGLSFGIGIVREQISIDYGFGSLGGLGNVHRFGISYNL